MNGAVVNRLQVHTLLEKTGKWYAAAAFLGSVPIYCRDYEKSSFQSEAARRAIANFVWCSKRALYFCRQTLLSIEECLDDNYIHFFRENIIPITPNSSIYPDNIPYGETVVFNFDAFVFAVRTLFEKHFVRTLNFLEGDSYEYVERLASLYHEQLVKPGLLTIRNEVVHYNYSGSTSAYTGSIKETAEGWDISIESNFVIKGRSSRADLLILFSQLSEGAILYISGILGIIVGSYYQTFGPPVKDQGFQWNDYSVKLSDFEVPNFDVHFG